MVILPIYNSTYEHGTYTHRFKLTIHLGCIYIIGTKHLALWFKSIDNHEALKVFLHDYPNTIKVNRGTNDTNTYLHI